MRNVGEICVNIELDLSKHCIQTEIKRHYNRALARYFKSGSDDKPRIEQHIALFSYLLEHFDFPQLRSRHAALAGGTDAEVILFVESDRQVRLSIKNDTAETTLPCGFLSQDAAP